MGSALALPIFVFVKSNYFVELSCASIFAAASPIARACFFPLNRISARVRLPSEFFFTTAESNAHWHLEVAGDLDLDPQPTVVAGGSRHASSTRLSVTGSGRVRLRERIQIGRTDERHGFWSGSLHADVDGEPLLRHRFELGGGSVAHDVLGAPLASVSELRYPDVALDALGTVLELADGGCLATWQGDRLGPN